MTNRNFQYAPGLPGYGNKGVDGSTGLQGLAMYFSEFDGLTDTITIKNKIISNKILFSADEVLPGYPGRTYQTGDLFIDKNGLVWKIDFTESNKYVATTAGFTVNSFFEYLNIPTDIGYDRYFPTDKNLIDIVASTSGAINYTTVPANIYLTKPVNFAQWKYANVLSSGNTDNYYPFTVFTIGSGDENAIAITRDQSINNWHLGNLDNAGNQRNVDLSLDFQSVQVGANLQVDASGIFFKRSSAAVTNFDIMILPDTISSSGIDMSLTGWNAYDQASTSLDSPNGGSGRLRAGSGGNHTAASAHSHNGGDGGWVILDAGDAGDTVGTSSGAEGGAGGIINILAGTGGDSNGGAGGIGGAGGDIFLKAGPAGDALARVTSGSGKAGNIELTAGAAGDSAASLWYNKPFPGDIILRGGLDYAGDQYGVSSGRIKIFGRTLDVSTLFTIFRSSTLDVSTSNNVEIASGGDINMAAAQINVKPENALQYEVKRKQWGSLRSTELVLVKDPAYNIVSNIDTEDTNSKKMIFKFSGHAGNGTGNILNIKFEVSSDNSSWSLLSSKSRDLYSTDMANDNAFFFCYESTRSERYFRVTAAFTDAASSVALSIMPDSLFEIFINE